MSNQIWYFDRFGTPSFLYLENENSFINKHGKNLGYVKSGKQLYNYKGRHVGWIENGVIRDLNGHCVAFASGSLDFPSPIFPIPQIPPIPNIPQIPHIKPIKSFGWSDIGAMHFFD